MLVSCEQKDNPLIGKVISFGVCHFLLFPEGHVYCLLQMMFVAMLSQTNTHYQMSLIKPHHLVFISGYVIWLFSFFVLPVDNRIKQQLKLQIS